MLVMILDRGSTPLSSIHGGIAQLGEHLPCTQGVKGSNPFISILSQSSYSDGCDFFFLNTLYNIASDDLNVPVKIHTTNIANFTKLEGE